MFGLLNPWVILGILVASITALGGTYFYGVGVGKDKVEVVWQAREAKTNAATAVAVQAAGAKTLAAERASAEAVASVSAGYQAKLKEKDREKATALAIAGGLRIGTARPAARGNAVSPTDSGPVGRDGEASAELSRDSAEFLIGEASRADKVVEQLTACQAIIKSDRSTK